MAVTYAGMPPQELRPLVDRLIPGGLVRFLTEQRVNERASYETIARKLQIAHDITVTGETVRGWCVAEGLTERGSGDAA